MPSGETRAVVGSHGDYDEKDDTPSFAERYAGIVTVRPADPGNASAHGEATFEMRWPEATCGASVDARRRERSRQRTGSRSTSA